MSVTVWETKRQKLGRSRQFLCKESNKCLFYNAFRHVIHSATKNKRWIDIDIMRMNWKKN